MIHKPFWIGLILVLGCLLLLVIMTSPGGQVAAAPISATPVSITSVPRSPGLPAIRPSLQAASTTSAASTLIPRFTSADVQAYLHTHPFVGGQVVQGATASIASIQFMSSAQASALMHEAATGLPATAPVCYVKLNGPFTQQAAPVAPGAKQLSAVAYGVEIFDAQTGNLLMWWTPSV